MQLSFFQKLQFFSGASSLIVLVQVIAYAEELNQVSALEQVELQYKIAMERSFQGSTTSAMQALLDLESSKLTGAFKNGYKAYQQYLESEKYEHLSYQSAKKRLSLGGAQDLPSIQSKLGPVSEDARAKEKLTKYDRKFLYKGTSGDVAAEFEKRTGMPREEFFTFMVVAAEKKIHPTDPNLFSESTRRFNALVGAIRNQKFKENVKHAASLVPESVQSSGVMRAVQKLVGQYVQELGSELIAIGIKSRVQNPTISDAKVAGREPLTAVVDKAELLLAGTSERKLASAGSGNALKMESRELAVEEESIFAQVSKRYQLVAVSRLGVKAMEP